MAPGREKSTFVKNAVGTIYNINNVWRGGHATRLPAGFSDLRHRPLTPKKRIVKKKVNHSSQRKESFCIAAIPHSSLLALNHNFRGSSFLLKNAKEKAND